MTLGGTITLRTSACELPCFLVSSMVKSSLHSRWDVSKRLGICTRVLFNVLTLAYFPFLGTAKAQSVETELITSHREEASQLKKAIAQKDDDLHRTVQKYEQVIQVLYKNL